MNEPKPTGCRRCDFSSGYRGMDRCHVCDGTGSAFHAAGAAFPNTEAGFRKAILAEVDAGMRSMRNAATILDATLDDLQIELWGEVRL